MTKGSKITFKAKFERDTKGAVRYQELDAGGNPVTTNNGAKVGTIYIRKTALGGVIPQMFSVEMTAE